MVIYEMYEIIARYLNLGFRYKQYLSLTYNSKWEFTSLLSTYIASDGCLPIFPKLGLQPGIDVSWLWPFRTFSFIFLSFIIQTLSQLIFKITFVHFYFSSTKFFGLEIYFQLGEIPDKIGDTIHFTFNLFSQLTNSLVSYLCLNYFISIFKT